MKQLIIILSFIPFIAKSQVKENYPDSLKKYKQLMVVYKDSTFMYKPNSFWFHYYAKKRMDAYSKRYYFENKIMSPNN